MDGNPHFGSGYSRNNNNNNIPSRASSRSRSRNPNHFARSYDQQGSVSTAPDSGASIQFAGPGQAPSYNVAHVQNLHVTYYVGQGAAPGGVPAQQMAPPPPWSSPSPYSHQREQMPPPQLPQRSRRSRTGGWQRTDSPATAANATPLGNRALPPRMPTIGRAETEVSPLPGFASESRKRNRSPTDLEDRLQKPSQEGRVSGIVPTVNHLCEDQSGGEQPEPAPTPAPTTAAQQHVADAKSSRNEQKQRQKQLSSRRTSGLAIFKNKYRDALEEQRRREDAVAPLVRSRIHRGPSSLSGFNLDLSGMFGEHDDDIGSTASKILHAKHHND